MKSISKLAQKKTIENKSDKRTPHTALTKRTVTTKAKRAVRPKQKQKIPTPHHTSQQRTLYTPPSQTSDDDLAPIPQHTLAATSRLSTASIKAKLDENKEKKKLQSCQSRPQPSATGWTYSYQLTQSTHQKEQLQQHCQIETTCTQQSLINTTTTNNNSSGHNHPTVFSSHNLSSTIGPTDPPPPVVQQPYNAMFPISHQIPATPNSYHTNAIAYYDPTLPLGQNQQQQQYQPHIHHRNIFHNVTSVPPPESFLHPPQSTTVPQSSQSGQHHQDGQYETYLHQDNSQLFTKPVRSVLLIKKWQSKQATLYSNHIADYLTQNGIQVFIEPTSIYDYDVDYPTILDLMHQVDIDTYKHLPQSFPSFQDTILSSKHASMVHKLHEKYGEEAVSPETNSWSSSPKQIPPNNPETESIKNKTANQERQTNTTQPTNAPTNPNQTTPTGTANQTTTTTTSITTTTTTTQPTDRSHTSTQHNSQQQPKSTKPRHYNSESPNYSPQINEELRQLSTQSFWKDFTRPESIKPSFNQLEQRECIPFARKYEKWQELIDVVVAVGGDGTLLHVSTLFGHQVPPVLGFSCGSFGFLMPFNPDRAEQAIDKVIQGKMRYQSRARIVFKVQPTSQQDTFPINQYDPDCFHLLNEIVLKHSYTLNSSSSVSDIECRVNGHQLARYQGDGLIIASPTGSTAYSLAAGGSIIHPTLDCIIITPIAPMTLSSRPVIIPADSILTLAPISSPVLLEGKYGRIVYPGETIVSTLSKFPLPVFCRRDATSDFMQDLGSRMNYARMFRFKREDDDVTDIPQGKQGVFLSKRTESDQTQNTPPQHWPHS